MFVSFILRRPFAFWWYAIADKYKLESFNENIILIFIPTDDYANSQSQSIIIIIAMQYFRAQQIAPWLRKIGLISWIRHWELPQQFYCIIFIIFDCNPLKRTDFNDKGTPSFGNMTQPNFHKCGKWFDEREVSITFILSNKRETFVAFRNLYNFIFIFSTLDWNTCWLMNSSHSIRFHVYEKWPLFLSKQLAMLYAHSQMSPLASPVLI